MSRRRLFLILLIIFLLFVALLIALAARRYKTRTRPPVSTPPSVEIITPKDSSVVKEMRVLVQNGGRMDWSQTLDLIVFDRKGQDGYYNIWTMKPDGSNQTCVSCDNPTLPGKHAGQPRWHPFGDWIVFQAEKENHRGSSIKARPGVGAETDIWVISHDGKKAYQLTNLAAGTATLHPYFSYDGKKLLWAERLAPPPIGQLLGGEWAMRLADFTLDEGGARVENIKTLQPLGKVFYETHGFTKDGSKIIFTSHPEGTPAWAMDIYTYDLTSSLPTNLTVDPGNWDEHGKLSPSEKHLVWMSSKDCGCDPSNLGDLKTDLWLINSDGSNKVRLTHFSDKNYPEYRGKTVIVGDTAWSPDGTKVITRLIVDRGLAEWFNLSPEKEPMVIMEFREPQ